MEMYVHFPFCVKKCAYCDFVSFPGQESQMEPYIDALISEAEIRVSEMAEPIDTVYFGGGTPSLIPDGLMDRLISRLTEIFSLSSVREWTVEANPGTLSYPWLETVHSAGINRLSLGMQAKKDEQLSLLGRIHRYQDVLESVRAARSAGFNNLSLDLIFGIPGQSLQDWEEALSGALDLSPDHISAYGLIPENGTPLYNALQAKSICLPEPEEERRMYEMALSMLSEAGYAQYEISNFARKGFACSHNIGYWSQIPYIGLGVSAASMINVVRDEEGLTYLRKTNTGSLREYFIGLRNKNPSLSEEVRISSAESRFETMMLGLRMNEGISEKRFQDLHGKSLETCFGKKLRSSALKGLVEKKDGCWRLTRRGMDLQNMVLVALME